jgi:hypothetical protein
MRAEIVDEDMSFDMKLPGKPQEFTQALECKSSTTWEKQNIRRC